MINFKFISEFLKWLMSLPGLKIAIVICLIIMTVQQYTIHDNQTKHDLEKVHFRSLIKNYVENERNQNLKTDSVVGVVTQKYEDLLMRIIEKAEKTELEQKQVNEITQKTIQNLTKRQ